MTEINPSIGIFTTDADLVIQTWDPWLARVTGIAVEAAVGRPLTALVPDLEERRLLAHFRRVLDEGVVEVLAPAFHHYLIPCPPQSPSPRFRHMQQHVTIAPWSEDNRVVGAIVTIEDVTARLDRERDEAERGELVEALAAEDWRVRRAAVEDLTHRPAPTTVAALLRALRQQHRDLNLLNSALQALAHSDAEIVASLAEFLADPDAELRTYAALTLGERRDPAAIPALIRALDDPDPNVVYHAIEALGKLRATEAAERLAQIASSGDFFLAFPALDALTQIGDPGVAERILPLLEDDLLAAPAAEALGQLGGEEVAVPLASLLNRPAAPVTTLAVALAALYDRYEKLYREGAHIADLVAPVITAAGVQGLLDALDEAQPDELRGLALVLGWLEGPAVDRALTRLLGQPSARRDVVEALVRHGPRVTELLIEQLEAADLDTRQAAVIALGRIGDGRAVLPLTRLLADDPELAVVTAGALAKIGDRRAFEALLGLVGHPDAAVRQAIVSALNSLGHPEMPGRAAVLLHDPDPHVRESAVRIAGYFGYPECVDGLLACCQDPDEGVRRAAVEHIAYLEDERVLPTLIEALQDAPPRVRAAAARGLAHVPSGQALPHLLAALADPDPWVRYYAARSIGQHGSPEALEPLARLVQEDPAPHVRAAGMEALGRIGGGRAVAVLAPLAEASDPDLARPAINALGLVGHPDAMPPLLAALRSPLPERRIDAVRAIAARGGVGAAGALQWTAAADADPQVVAAAIEALARLGTADAVAALVALSADPSCREACIAALAGLREEQIEWIAHGLEHPHAGVRRAVVEALARMKRPRASDQLSRGLEDRDPSVRLAAITALARLGSRRAERTLANLARSDPDAAVRRAAQAALQG